MQVGNELCAVLFQRSKLRSELLQVAVDPRRLGPRAPLPMVAIVVGAVHQLLDLAPQEPNPGIAVNDANSVSRPASIAATISSWVSANSLRAVLSLSVAPFRFHSSSTEHVLPSTRSYTRPQCNALGHMSGSHVVNARGP